MIGVDRGLGLGLRGGGGGRCGLEGVGDYGRGVESVGFEKGR